MKMSAEGLRLLTEREGKRNQMYRDSAGLPTIGVGHLLTKDELTSGKLQLPLLIPWGDGISDETVEALLKQDVRSAEDTVTTAVWSLLNQNQFDALCSFCFNVGNHAFGNSTLVRLLNEGEYDQVPAQLRRWHFSGGQDDPGLAQRREGEVEQWLRPPQPSTP